MKYQKNTIKVDLGSYRHYIRGIKKSGKSTLFRDLCFKAYGRYDAGLIIAPGNEKGYLALDSVYAIEAIDWSTFVEIVDDLVENKADNTFKLIALDTIDELISIAIKKTLQVHFQRKGEKVDTINQAMGGYSAGQVYVQDIVNNQLARLENAGYGLFFIGHCKLKTIKKQGDSSEEDGYQQLTGTLDGRFESIFADKADIICTINVEREVDNGHVTGTQRYLYFRSDGFVDAGGRFTNMPEKVEMSAENYLAAFEQGVRSSFMDQSKVEKIEDMRKIELAEKEESAQKFVEESKAAKVMDSVPNLVAAIDEKISSLDANGKSKMKEIFKEKKLPLKFKEEKDVEVLKTILAVLG